MDDLRESRVCRAGVVGCRRVGPYLAANTRLEKAVDLPGGLVTRGEPKNIDSLLSFSSRTGGRSAGRGTDEQSRELDLTVHVRVGLGSVRCEEPSAAGTTEPSSVHQAGCSGDEARVARAGSGRGESSFANGTPSSRTLPPRAGWAVRQTTAVSSSPLLPASASSSSATVSSGLGQWANENQSRSSVVRSPSSSRTGTAERSSSSASNIVKSNSSNPPPASSLAGTATSALTAGGLLHQQQESRHSQPSHLFVERGATSNGNRWPERLELRGAVVPMSQNVSPPSRPPSSASSASSTSAANLPRVHGTSLGGHDHTRPLPPPRLPETGTGITTISSSSISSLTLAPLTAPLTPLSTSASFRSNSSRTPITGSIGSTNTITTSHHVQQNNVESGGIVVPGVPNASSVNTTTSSQSRASSGTTGGTTDSSRSPLGEVTLTVPRPDGERALNEYVETPFRQSNATATNLNSNLVSSNQKCLKNERRLHHSQPLNHHQLQQQHQQQLQHQRQAQQQNQQAAAQAKSTATAALVAAQARHQLHDNNSTGIRRHQSHLLQSSLSATSPGTAVTKQPVSFTKEPANALGSGSLGGVGGRLNDPSLSIMCDFCGRCRCESCRQPHALPHRWLCDQSCLLSADTALDYASCLCCVKGLFYHCADSGSGTDSEAGGNCADEPCSCTGPRRTARWACLGALTCVLPCLLCYWPLKGCVAMCEACYARQTAQGCRCDPNTHGRHHTGGAASVVSRDSRDPEKRLLDPVTPEL